MRGVLLEKGFSYDVIDTVLAVPNPDLYDVWLRVRAIQSSKGEEYFNDLLVVFNRAYNLSRKADPLWSANASLVDDSEKALYQAIQGISAEFAGLIGKAQYQQAMQLMAGLRPAVDRF